MEQEVAPEGLNALLAFHGEVRRLIRRMHGFGAQAPGLLSPVGAQEVLDFLTGPLVWHDVDEETLMMPMIEERLAHVGVNADPGLEQCHRDHERLERLVEGIVVHLADIAGGVESNPVLLKTAAAEFDALLSPHFELEERVVFPTAKRLFRPQDHERLARSLQERRTLRLKTDKASTEDLALRLQG